MGGNPILQKLSQIDKRADATRDADIGVGDVVVSVDIPGTIAAVESAPDAP